MADICANKHMHGKSTEEIRSHIATLRKLIELRENNERTLNVTTVAAWKFYSIRLDVLRKIEASGYEIKGKKEIAIESFNNLNITFTLEKLDEFLYRLCRIVNRIQCESDSSYDSSDAESDSDGDVHVTKVKETYYLTKSDTICLVDHLLKLNKK